MELLVRLVRALFVFGVILVDYLVFLAMRKPLRRWVKNPENGREEERSPAWLKRYEARLHERNARRLLRGMLRLRGVYIKLGQVLSMMGGFLPVVYGRELESLQDAVPPQRFETIDRALRESLGAAYEAGLERVDPHPLAAASLGQVHVAYTKDGTKLALKVLYPGIRDVIRVDMRVIRLAVRVYRFFVPIGNIESVHASLVDLLRRETDYLHEAECMRRMSANFAHADDVDCPAPIDSLTTRDVLAMTFMDGFKITDLSTMGREGIEPTAVATRLTQIFYEMLFVHRFFHADPHPGNFLVLPLDAGRFKLVILDFGAVTEAREAMINGMVDVLRGFFEQNDDLAMKGIERIGFVAVDGDRQLLERTVKVYFQKLLKLEARTPGALMNASEKELESLADPELERKELRALMRSVHYPDEWFYVERAAVLSFWLVARLDPHLDMAQIGFPYILPLLSQSLQQSSAPEG
jgi:ubiquinone biosynthesis protein